MGSDVPNSNGPVESISAIIFEPLGFAGGQGAEEDLRRALDKLGVPFEIVAAAWGHGSDYASAFWEAVARCSGTFLITLDGELSQDPNFVRNFWAVRHRADLIIASRFDPGGAYLGPLWRWVLARLGNGFGRWVLSLPYRDLTSSLRMYRRSALEEIRPLSQARGFDLLVEAVVLLHGEGRSICELPFVDFRRRPEVSRARVGQVGIAVLGCLVRLWKLRNSLVSADYDDRAFNSRILFQRYWQRRRVRAMTRLVDSPDGIVDVGCGSGKIVQSFPTAVGVDILLKKLRFLRPHNSKLVAGDIVALPFRDGAFRTAVCSEVVEHVPFDERIFAELARVLRPGGQLVLSTPDYGRLRWRVAEWLYARLMPGGYGHEHVEHYDQPRLRQCLLAHGLEPVTVRHHFGAIVIIRAQKARS
jgi:SAM-dependent methyltransferase